MLALLLVPVRKKEEHSICCFLQEEEEKEKAAQERQEDFPLCLFVPGSRVNLTCLSPKEERWELSKVEFFKKSFQEACGELWVEMTRGWVESPGERGKPSCS